MISVPWNMSRATKAAPSCRASGQRRLVRSSNWRAAFEHGGIERLLDHARRFKAENLEGSRGIFGADAAGPFAPPDGCIDFERGGGGDQLAVVFDRLHQANKSIRSRFSYK